MIPVSASAPAGHPAEDAPGALPAAEPDTGAAVEPAADAESPPGSPAAEEEQAVIEQSVEGAEIADQHEDENEAAAAAAGAPTKASVALNRQRRTPSGLRRLIETLVGARRLPDCVLCLGVLPGAAAVPGRSDPEVRPASTAVHLRAHGTAGQVKEEIVRLDARLPALVLTLIVPSFARLEAATDARVGPSTPATAGPAGYARIQRLSAETTMAVSNNGLTVLVEENHAAPVATVRCFVKNTGSAYEGKNLGAGVSHVLEHVVSGGTTTRHTEKEIDKIIASFGGVSNAATSTDMTVFYIDCPAKNVMTAIGLVADSMQRVKFEPAEFERELKVVRRELADDEVDRQLVLGTLLQATVYTTHPAHCPVIGYLDVLNGTTNRTIIDFYRERYVPNNQVFVVVGDVETPASARRDRQAIRRHARAAATPTWPWTTSPNSLRCARPSARWTAPPTRWRSPGPR